MKELIMSYRVEVPKGSESWDDYWSKKKIDDDLKLCESDELWPMFEAHLTKKMRILEAGSGLGKWVITLTRRGYQIVGLDNYDKGLMRVKTWAKEVAQVVGSVATLPIANNSVDAYLSLGVVEHFEAGPKVPLKEAFRVLKPGGIAFIEVPFHNPLRRLGLFWLRLTSLIKAPFKRVAIGVGLKKARTPMATAFYEYHYTRKELTSFVKAAGFEMMELLPKDDVLGTKSIGLWLDYPGLRLTNGELFTLTKWGQWVKAGLKSISPWLYSALVVAIVKKPMETT
jgi:ubiquinone/menaquinone biosynthesis C-methylase UbiE